MLKRAVFSIAILFELLTPPRCLAVPTTAFYYWKTTWAGSSELEHAFDKFHASKLYLRLFDVSWDKSRKGVFPVAPLEIKKAIPEKIEIVPVVFLTQSIFTGKNAPDPTKLAEQVFKKVQKLARHDEFQFQELQMDCDWTDSSKKSYFSFLRELGKLADAQKISISATIRLHQAKYYQLTGIPPVSRGMLMFYNMGKIEANAERLSIYNSPDASRYTESLQNYPLPLDIVLPTFSWGVQSREGHVVALLENVGKQELSARSELKSISERRYQVNTSFFLHGRYFRKNDFVDIEAVDANLTEEAGALAAKSLQGKSKLNTVAFFDLNERTLKTHAPKDLQKTVLLFQ